MVNFHIYRGTRLFQTLDIMNHLYKVSAVQAEGVQYRLRVCSTGGGCALWAEGVQYRLRGTLCSASLSLYCTPSACTAHMCFIQGGPVGQNVISMVLILIPLESQCLKTVSKNVYEFGTHRWLQVYPKIFIV